MGSLPQGSDRRKYSACFCQPLQAGRSAPLFPVTHDPANPPCTDLAGLADTIRASVLNNRVVLGNTEKRVDPLYNKLRWFLNEGSPADMESFRGISQEVGTLLSEIRRHELKEAVVMK